MKGLKEKLDVYLEEKSIRTINTRWAIFSGSGRLQCAQELSADKS